MDSLVFGSADGDHARQRAELRAAEIALRDQRERVAELRRKLSPEPVPKAYVLREVPAVLSDEGVSARDVSLAQLFDDPEKPLVLMHFMYGKSQTEPCPMCSLWADGYDGVVPHLQQRVNFAVLVAGDAVAFRAYARSRGWRNLRVVSAGDSSLKRDLGFETEEGAQLPGVSVFVLAEDGSARHFYSGCAFYGAEGFRGMDLLSPLWGFLDLTPEGRGDFMPQLSYPGAYP